MRRVVKQEAVRLANSGAAIAACRRVQPDRFLTDNKFAALSSGAKDSGG